jgi:hypothetical protein
VILQKDYFKSGDFSFIVLKLITNNAFKDAIVAKARGVLYLNQQESQIRHKNGIEQEIIT